MGIILGCNSEAIHTAVDIIKNGGIAIFPTDTVYGIGCDPYNRDAVEKIFKIKKRDISKLFPVLGFSKEDLSKITIFDEKSNKIAKQFWPGPITLILKIKDEKLRESLGLKEKIAVRVPNNSCTLAILKECRFLVGTSANLTGKTPSRDPDDSIKNLKGFDVFVNGGILPFVKESTVVEFENNELIIHREGAITKKEILKIL